MCDKRTILAWDVGIKNLAYCKLQVDYNEDTMTILDWNIISLTGEKIKCSRCIKLATYQYTNHENNTIYFCATHVDKFSLDLTKDENHICQKLNTKKVRSCTKNTHMIIPNTGYGWCKDHYDAEFTKYEKKYKIKKFKQESCMKAKPHELVLSLYEKLDFLSDTLLFDVDEIVIENQPSLKNPTMKAVSTILFTYFVDRGIYQKLNDNDDPVKDVKFVAPSGKLKVDDIDQSKLTYKDTKKIAIYYTRSVINKRNLKFFNEHKKKDDLADAFLHAFKNIHRGKIPKQYNQPLKEAYELYLDDKDKKEKKTKKRKQESSESE